VLAWHPPPPSTRPVAFSLCLCVSLQERRWPCDATASTLILPAHHPFLCIYLLPDQLGVYWCREGHCPTVCRFSTGRGYSRSGRAVGCFEWPAWDLKKLFGGHGAGTRCAWHPRAAAAIATPAPHRSHQHPQYSGGGRTCRPHS
jgi:hypothetical protein